MHRPRLVFCLAGVALAACSSSTHEAPGDAARPRSTNEAGRDDAGAIDGRARDAGSRGAVRDAEARDSGAAHDAGKDAGFVEAPHGAFPQVPNNGGPTLTAPKLVTITFAGYNQATTIDSFGDWVVTSDWLTTVGHDYGIGHGTHAANIVLPGPAPAMAADTDTQTLLEDNLMSGVLPSAPLDAGALDGGAGQYLYLIVYPSTTTTGSFLGGPDSCTYEGGGSFIGGYHWETQTGPYHVPYAVIPTCASGSMVEGAADLETSASHELIEAATDPFPDSHPAWAIEDQTNPWIATDGELADLCEGLVTTESGFTPQRVWSNTAAASNSEPCVPAPASTVLYDVTASPATTQLIAAGKSVAYTLTGFSTAPTMPWSLEAFAGGGSFTPTVDLSATTMNNGQMATLTVGIPPGTPSQSYGSVYITSYYTLSDFNYWIVAVAVP